MRLEDWMRARGVSDEELADRVGVSRASISRIRRSKMNVSMATAQRIYAATDGAVQPNDLAHLELSLRRRA